MVGFDVFDFFDEGVEAGLELVGVTGDAVSSWFAMLLFPVV